MLQHDLKLGFTNSEWDTWLSEPINDDDIAWFQQNMSLSREDLSQIFARAKDIVRGLKPNDELLYLSYDTDHGNWYLHFHSSVPNGRLHVSIHRKDAMTRSRKDGGGHVA